MNPYCPTPSHFFTMPFFVFACFLAMQNFLNNLLVLYNKNKFSFKFVYLLFIYKYNGIRKVVRSRLCRAFQPGDEEHKLRNVRGGERVERDFALFAAFDYARGAQHTQLVGKRGLINAYKRGHVAYTHFAHGKGGNYAKSPRVGECGERLGGIRECGVRGEILFDERFRARVEQGGAPFLSEYIVLFYYHK